MDGVKVMIIIMLTVMVIYCNYDNGRIHGHNHGNIRGHSHGLMATVMIVLMVVVIAKWTYSNYVHGSGRWLGTVAVYSRDN